MRKIYIVAALAFCASSTLVFPQHATAATTGDTPVTVEVSSGMLAITVPAGPVNLGSVTASALPQTVRNQLGDVSVTDGRGGTLGWTATARGVDFAGPTNISVSACGSSGYTTPSAKTTGTATVEARNLTALAPTGVVQVATGVSGVNTATWNPTISVTIPGSAPAGTYKSTITHSVF
ncbi:WxL domain-containing protein [Streptomyces violascens]|uniref:hypothetical protein n=1 Tax=Streptomyces violascens TaxID=67381 RepID=UPI0036A01F5F